MKKTIGILYLLNGISMLIVWPMLIITKQAPEIETNLTYMCFHLSAELLTAILCVVTGIGLLLKKAKANKFYFLTTGFFIAAGYLAIGYYLFSDLSSGIQVLIMLIVLNLIGLVLFITTIRKGLLIKSSNDIKFSLFFSGVIAYTLLNIAGFLSEMNTGYTYGYVSMTFIIIVYIIWKIRIDLNKTK